MDNPMMAHTSTRFVGFAPAVALLLVSFYGCGESGGKQSGSARGRSAEATPVEAFLIVPRPLENKIQTTGTLLANEEVELRPEMSGRVTGIFFDEGTRVRQGDLLLQINDQELAAQLRRKEFEEKLAADEEERKRHLHEISGISQEEYDKSLYLLKMVQSEREVIESQLRETQIRAPFDGIIGLRQVSDGGFVSPSMLVATMQDLDPIKVEFSIPEKYARQIASGTKIVVAVGETGDTREGTVYAVDARIDPGTRTIKARAKVPNTDESLIPGAFARVEITLETIPEAIVVPSGAIIPEINGEKVFVSVGGQARSVPVRTGLRLERETQIVDGLSPNDTLIVSGLLQLADGRPVQITALARP
ncbi:MAG: efflux RND transporter periplasmic adaptor subunit [Candidatus Zixiibacteriota bacterium]